MILWCNLFHLLVCLEWNSLLAILLSIAYCGLRIGFFFLYHEGHEGYEVFSRCGAAGRLRWFRFSRWIILRNHNEICHKMHDGEWNKHNRDAENQQQKATSMPIPFCDCLHSWILLSSWTVLFKLLTTGISYVHVAKPLLQTSHHKLPSFHLVFKLIPAGSAYCAGRLAERLRVKSPWIDDWLFLRVLPIRLRSGQAKNTLRGLNIVTG